MVKLTIVVDNEATKGFKREYGFACLVETGNEKILFDTGASAETLAYNANKLGIRPEYINKLVISHLHYDHIGGIDWVLQNKSVRIFLPEKPSGMLKEKLSQFKIEIVTDATEIASDIFSTGAKNTGIGIKEQALIVKSSKGATLITGCMHANLEKFIAEAEKIAKLQAIVGGFHSFSNLELLKRFSLVMPCHCTFLKKEILENFPQAKSCKAGLQIEL